jgi:hypothetical protein
VAVGDLAGAQGGGDLTVHLLVAEDHAREVHDLAERDHVLPPREGLGDLLGTYDRPRSLERRRGRRDAGGYLHVGGERRGARLLDHEPEPF